MSDGHVNGGHVNDVLLEVEHLDVEFFTRRGRVHAVRDVSFQVRRGETLGIVGESGSGKSVTAQALLGLIDLPGRITGGDVRWRGDSLVGAGAPAVLQRVRGNEIAMVFQDPMTSLNPTFTIGFQIGEVLRQHQAMGRRDAAERVVELLDLVGIANPRERARQHPHEMSGGMRQRVLIAMALACDPMLLIADEPTTALDVTIQAQILDLIADVQERLGLAVILITHDLGVVAGVCDRVLVMYGGRVVEQATAHDLYRRPGHPYSAGLLRATPRLDEMLPRLVSIDGSPPDLLNPTVGCAFAPRCALAVDRCLTEVPALDRHDAPIDERAREDRHVACWRAFDDVLV